MLTDSRYTPQNRLSVALSYLRQEVSVYQLHPETTFAKVIRLRNSIQRAIESLDSESLEYANLDLQTWSQHAAEQWPTDRHQQSILADIQGCIEDIGRRCFQW